MLSRKTLLHFANTIAGGVLGVIALKLIALWMGDAVLGNVSYAIGVLSILQSLTTLAMRSTHEKRMGEGGDEGDKIATYLYLILALSAVFAAIVGSGLFVWVGLLGKTFRSTTLTVVVIITAYLTAQNLRQVAVNTFNGRRELARSQSVTFLDDLARVGATVVAAALYGAVVRERGPLHGMLGEGWGWVEAYGPELLAGTYVAGTGLSALVGLVLMRRACPLGRFRWDLVKNYWSYARPVFVTSVLGALTTNIDRAMLGYFWTSAEVGLYFGMDRITHIAFSLSFAMGTVLIPQFSSMAVDEDYEGIARVADRSHRYITLVVLPMAVGMIVFAEPLIRLVLADEFLRGAPVLMVLAAWVVLAVANRPYRSAVLGLDRPDLVLKLGVAAVAANVVLNLILVPADLRSLGISLFGLGALGAAIGTLSHEAIHYVGYHVYAKRLLPIEPRWGQLVRQLAAAAVMAGVLWWLAGLVGGLLRWYHVLGFGGLGVVAYLLALRLLGGLPDEDVRFFVDTVNPGKMGRYVRDEFRDDEDEE